MNKDLFKEIYLSFLFLGRAPVAPGTFGTLGGVVLALLVTNYLESNAGYALLILIPIIAFVLIKILNSGTKIIITSNSIF